MKGSDLEQISKQLAQERQQVLALAHLLDFGVLVDAQAIAVQLAREISATARELEARTNQLELELKQLTPREEPKPRDGGKGEPKK